MSYIGEASRYFDERAMEHLVLDKMSSIFKHLSNNNNVHLFLYRRQADAPYKLAIRKGFSVIKKWRFI